MSTYQGNANQNHKETLLYDCSNVCTLKNGQVASVIKKMEKLKLSFEAGGKIKACRNFRKLFDTQSPDIR